MNCVLCNKSHAFGFFINDATRNICIDCVNTIKNLKHYAPNPFQNQTLTEAK